MAITDPTFTNNITATIHIPRPSDMELDDKITWKP